MTSRPEPLPALQNFQVVLIANAGPSSEALQRDLEASGLEVLRERGEVPTMTDRVWWVPDALLLDLNTVPLRTARQIIAAVRRRHLVPLIALGSHVRLDPVSELLNLGASDYLPAPYTCAELLARLQARVRRYCPGIVKFGPLRLNVLERRGTLCGSELPLGGKEFGVLQILAACSGGLVTNAELKQAVWVENSQVSVSIVAVTVLHLRQKLALICREIAIETVARRGYRLTLFTSERLEHVR